MNLPLGDKSSNKFITNLGLITSDGPNGPGVMACEWTHHISFSPGLIAVCIRPHDATHENIKHTKEFGVNLCANDQSVMASVSGGYSGKEYDKINALKELGFEFYKANKIKAPMIKDTAMNAECKLLHEISLGDHTMFVGEVVDVSTNSNKEPLVYHNGKYWIMNTNVAKPSQSERERTRKIVETFKKNV